MRGGASDPCFARVSIGKGCRRLHGAGDVEHQDTMRGAARWLVCCRDGDAEIVARGETIEGDVGAERQIGGE
jgi:hypothetical protein